jgi:hypothetical protein
VITADWLRAAACRTGTRHPDTWHSDHPDEQAEARAVCQACPTLALCRATVLAAERGIAGELRHGIHGGLTGPERAALDPTAPAMAPPLLAECGTHAAYQRHLRRGEPIDERCRDDNRRRTAERKARAAA